MGNLYFLNYKNTSADFRVYILKPCPIIIGHVLLLTAQVLLDIAPMLPVIVHYSPLITHVLASLFGERVAFSTGKTPERNFGEGCKD